MTTRKAELEKLTVTFYRRNPNGVQWQQRHCVWWHTYTNRSKALRAIRTWINAGKIMKERCV